jgi:hypothetical protein
LLEDNWDSTCATATLEVVDGSASIGGAAGSGGGLPFRVACFTGVCMEMVVLFRSEAADPVVLCSRAPSSSSAPGHQAPGQPDAADRTVGSAACVSDHQSGA